MLIIETSIRLIEEKISSEGYLLIKQRLFINKAKESTWNLLAGKSRLMDKVNFKGK